VSRPLFAAPRILVGFLLAALVIAVAPTNAHAEGPIRLLLEGDSLTQGFHGDYTWRYRLAKEFARQGVPFDFVGSRNSPVVRSGWTTAGYADPNFDHDHFALVGSTLAWHVGQARREVAAQQPDVIVLEAGVNDIRHGATPEQTNDRLRQWVTNARAGKGDVRMVISPVLAATDATRPWLARRAAEYGRLAQQTVDEMTTSESPIVLANTTAGWSVPTHTYDNIHPNPTGETLIAQHMAEALQGVGVLTSRPNIYRATSWNRQPRVRVVVKSGRATLTWDAQALNGAHVSIRRVGYAAYNPAATYHGGHMTTSALVPKATYEFRISLIRGRMSTPWGPITRVTVPAPLRPAAVARVIVNSRGVTWSKSALATQYLVKFRRARTKRWVTVRTSRLYVAAGRVVQARVWAVNAGGRSAMRAGAR
jgi:hypothetical protein